MPVGKNKFSPFQKGLAVSESQPGSYWMGTEVFPEKWIDHSPPTTAEFKNEWSCASTPLHAFMTWTKKTLLIYPYFCMWLIKYRAIKAYVKVGT